MALVGGDGWAAASLMETVRYAMQQGFVINRTKLVKLIYFSDLRAVDRGLAVRSGFEWKWHHYGPFSSAILATEDALVYSGALKRECLEGVAGSSLVLVDGFTSSREVTDLDREFIEVVHSVVDELGGLTAGELSDKSYRTPPMLLAQEENGERGVVLDISMGERKKAIARQHKLSRLNSLASRRAIVRERRDEGDLRGLIREVDLQAGRRKHATTLLIGHGSSESA